MIATKFELLERTRALWNTAWSQLNAGRSQDAAHESVSRLDVYGCVSKLLPPEDDLADLAAWAFNQAIDRLASAEGVSKDVRLHIQNVSMNLFDEMMKSNLKHSSWAEEEIIWSNTPARPHDLN